MINKKEPSRKYAGLAIIDEHSTSTIIAKSAVEMLGIDSSQCTQRSYFLTTLEAMNSRKIGREIEGVQISSYFEDTPKDLSRCIESEDLPTMRDELPSKEDVQGIPEFKHLADQFPAKSVHLDSVILIGRDNFWMFKGNQYVEPTTTYM